MAVGEYDFNDLRSEQRRRMAVHEAGHAVIARKSGMMIGSVSVVSATSVVRDERGRGRRDYDGRCKIVGASARLFDDGVLNEMGRIVFIVQAMAGFEAEALICPGPAIELWRSDICDLADVARYNTMGEPLDLIGIRELARNVVSENRAAIEAVAVELSRRDEINGSELDAIIGEPRLRYDASAA
jgi:hypothetical protein